MGFCNDPDYVNGTPDTNDYQSKVLAISNQRFGLEKKSNYLIRVNDTVGLLQKQEVRESGISSHTPKKYNTISSKMLTTSNQRFGLQG